MLGVLVGLKQEARIIRRFLPDAPIAISNANAEGATRGAAALLRIGATKLLSFGCAGGLSSSVQPGTVIVADYIHVDGKNVPTDQILSARFGAHHARQGGILHSDIMIAEAEEKQQLYRETRCVAVDMESGVLARTGLPFAVLRVVCDDFAKDLPPAARVALSNGSVQVTALTRSLVRHPRQIGALITLGADAAKAQKAISLFLEVHPPQA